MFWKSSLILLSATKGSRREERSKEETVGGLALTGGGMVTGAGELLLHFDPWRMADLSTVRQMLASMGDTGDK